MAFILPFKSALQSAKLAINVSRSLFVSSVASTTLHCSVSAASIFCGTGTVVSVFMTLVGCGNVAHELRNRIRDALQRPVFRRFIIS